MNKLYPLKFIPVLKNTIWGGNKLNKELNKTKASDKCGESWEISGVHGNISVVENGFLAGNNLEEIIEIYMGDLVGDMVFENFGTQFPLLIKFIDANDNLSIQVHPDDELAYEEHGSSGKTEMWYIMDHKPDAKLIVGFNKELDQNSYLDYFENNKLTDIVNYETVQKGDVFYLPAGRIHAIGSGILLAEIQQTSDITYRIFDWNRTDVNGNLRQLHTEQALKALNFEYLSNYKTKYELVKNKTSNIVDCPYFFTNILNFDKSIEKDYITIDSFVIYMCLEGEVTIQTDDNEEYTFIKGETILLPAAIKNVLLIPNGQSKLLEVYLT
jgi:mannose-6-phosphate isomerase